MKRIMLGILVCVLLIPLGARPVQAGPPEYDPIIHIVQWGENLTGIARRYGTTVQAIMRANHIGNANRIYAGQRLIIPRGAPSPAPGGCTYTVRYGDTLSGIAYRHGVSINSIVRANHIVNIHRVYRGQRLVIPCASQPPPSYNPPSYQPPPQPAPLTAGTYYIVRRGDTLAKIAWRFGVRIWCIVRANNIANPNVIYAGQRLWIPKACPPGEPVKPVEPVRPVSPVSPGCEHLRWPRSGAWLSGVVRVRGTATHERFGYYKLEYRLDGLDDWHYVTGAEDPVENGLLGEWDTRTVNDGNYIFRLVIVDQTGNYPPPCEIAVHVNNDP